VVLVVVDCMEFPSEKQPLRGSCKGCGGADRGVFGGFALWRR
jgi:hypothetical protein